jgi:glycerophosphoryl diester phosphodiesterase
MSLKLPKIIGHRGACGYAPENTLESIQTAAEMGLKWVEFDVKLTQDQVPILMHDDILDRTTNGSGAVALTSYEDIRQMEAGSWFADSFSGIKIPTLEEAVNILLELDMGFNLELKPCPGREKETAEVVLDELSRIWDAHDRLLISCFQHVTLETAMEVAGDWKRGLLLGEEWPENWEELADYLDVASINFNGNTCTREQVEAIIDLDLKTIVYTINDPQKSRQLQAWGVDSLITDVPDTIMASILTVH